MTGLTFSTALPPTPTTRTRAPMAAPAARLSAAEEARIADAFPARPTVAQRLYGPGRTVQQTAPLGGRLDITG